MSPPRLRLVEIDLFEREMPFLHPFRFGDVTVRSAPQAFARVSIEVEGAAGISQGATAEMMMPRWFDRRPDRSPAETIEDLRASLCDARRRYLASKDFDTAFGHHVSAGSGRPRTDTPALVASYGPAVIDKAVLDALFKASGVGAGEGVRSNLAGLNARLTPDLDEAQIAAFLNRIEPRRSIALRWTVGLLDDLTELQDVIGPTGIGYLKVKLSGDTDSDLERLTALGRIIEAAPRPLQISLDANEQYDRPGLERLVDALESERFASLRSQLLYLEQPFSREASLDEPLGRIGENLPVIIDEADGTIDAFPRAIRLGYRGVSSKSCKGLYKAILNGARAEALNAASGRPGHLFVTAEDLTCQAGLSVQQDTALVAILGLTHVERNGHHYVDGFGPASGAEASRFARAHPELYAEIEGRWQLAVRGGRLSTASIVETPGFASGAEPDWESLTPVDADHVLEREMR